MDNGAELTREVGYVPLSDEAYEANKAAALGGMTPEGPTAALSGAIMEHGRGLSREVGYVPLDLQAYQGNMAQLR